MRPRSFTRLPLASITLALGLAACDGDFEVDQKPRTVRIVEGPAVRVGSNLTTCSHGPARGSPQRWCAFARPQADGRTELWVVDIRRVLAGDVRCDGTSAHCLRLTSQLWTGQPPEIHAFDGDTLIYYPGSLAANGERNFVGAVQAWRPGASPRPLTGQQGQACVGHATSPGVICVDNERRVSGEAEFDLLAGTFDSASEQPLPAIAAIRPLEEGDLLWQAAFSPSGSHLAFSDRVPEGGKVERLRILATGEIGRVPAREVLRDVSAWQFSPDGQQLFFLRGFNYGAGGQDSGTLAVADFPSGANARELQPRVGRFQVLGAPGGPAQAIGVYQDVTGFSARFGILSDPTRTGDVTAIASDVEEAVVSPDLRYSLLFAGDENGDGTTFVARNDGTGRCKIAAHPGRGVYAPTFLSSPPVLIWAEDAADNPLLSEGWLGDPGSCEPRQQFSTRLALYEPTRSGVVWGDLEDTARTLTLRYAPFSGTTLDLARTEELSRSIDNRVTMIDTRYVLFTVSRGSAAETGLFVHGPL